MSPVASAKFVLESKLRSSTFQKMSNVAIYHISVAFNFIFNSENGDFKNFRDTKSSNNSKRTGPS